MVTFENIYNVQICTEWVRWRIWSIVVVLETVDTKILHNISPSRNWFEGVHNTDKCYEKLVIVETLQ